MITFHSPEILIGSERVVKATRQRTYLVIPLETLEWTRPQGAMDNPPHGLCGNGSYLVFDFLVGLGGSIAFLSSSNSVQFD